MIMYRIMTTQYLDSVSGVLHITNSRACNSIHYCSTKPKNRAQNASITNHKHFLCQYSRQISRDPTHFGISSNISESCGTLELKIATFININILVNLHHLCDICCLIW